MKLVAHGGRAGPGEPVRPAADHELPLNPEG